MYEVELKVRAAHDPVRSRLSAVGADCLGAVRQVDTYYDAPHRDFTETDEALRIRRESPEDGEAIARVTYKGPLVDAASKTRGEAETGVADGDAMAAVLEGLGFEAAATVEKRRERYAHGGYAVVLDDVCGLGEFVEVETETEDDIEEAREGAAAVLETLDLDPDDGIRDSYLGMLLAGADGDNSE
jgi:adenylate cyclase class 2